MNKIILGVAAVLPLLALTACTGHAVTPRPTVTVTVTASPDSTDPEAAPLTRKQAGRRYLALVKPYNRAVDPCDKAMRAWNKSTWYVDDQTMIDRLHKACNPMVRAERRFGDGLDATPWPVEARGDVGDLVDYSRAELYAWEQTRAADTVDVVNAVAWPKDDGAADLVRARFGLRKRS